MRTHADIIAGAGGAHALSERLGMSDKFETVKSWYVRDNIPGEYWRMVADAEICTLDELATAAERRRVAKAIQKPAA